jgi:hypothetical protein
MEVPLPSGNKVVFRDVLLRGDIREARRGMVFVTAPDGSRRTDGAFLDDLTGRVIARMFVSWDYPADLRNAQGDHLQQQILDQLDSDDYAALEQAVGPWVQRIIRIGQQAWQFTHAATGVTVDVTDEDKAQALAVSPDFTQVEGAGPKLTGRSLTAISGPGSPAQSGPEPATDPTPETSG